MKNIRKSSNDGLIGILITIARSVITVESKSFTAATCVRPLCIHTELLTVIDSFTLIDVCKNIRISPKKIPSSLYMPYPRTESFLPLTGSPQGKHR